MTDYIIIILLAMIWFQGTNTSANLSRRFNAWRINRKRK